MIGASPREWTRSWVQTINDAMPREVPGPSTNFARQFSASTNVVRWKTSAMDHPSTQFLEEKNHG